MKYIFYCRSCLSNNVEINGAVLSPFITHRIFNMPPIKTETLYNMDNGTNYFPCMSLKCKDCDFLGVNILFSDDEMNNLYKGYRNKEYNTLRKIYEPEYDSLCFNIRNPYVSCVENIIKNNISIKIKTHIDYGGATGINTPKLCDNCIIYDVSSSKEKLINCDIITCMEVIEHVSEPCKILEEIKQTGSTYFYFDVPSCDNSIKKEHWHEHINFFNVKSFSNLLSRYFTIIYLEDSDGIIKVLCTK